MNLIYKNNLLGFIKIATVFIGGTKCMIVHVEDVIRMD